MYENIKKAVAEHEAKTLDKFNRDITSKTIKNILNAWYYKDYTTPKTLEALKELPENDLISKYPELLERIQAKKARTEAKNTKARLDKIARAEAAAVAPSIDISVEWTKSRTWGYNPHATIRGWARVTSANASGCGYDKQSAAIASAMNENPEVLRILYDHAETGQPFPYSVLTFAGLPYFDGGCGVSCFKDVFDVCGYDWRQVASGRTYDAYTMTRKA